MRRAGASWTGRQKEAADMPTIDTILDALREFWLSCIGSPQSRSRQLAALQRLDAHLLKDIGLTADEARRGAPLNRAAAKNAKPRAGAVAVRGAYPNR
jgi:uncharacterized protein YjiS (DUF1127 family)